MKRTALLMALAMAACSTAPPPPIIKTQFVSAHVSPDLLDCGRRPEVPQNVSRQSAVALFILKLNDWGSGCFDKLAAVKISLQKQGN